MKNYQDYFKDKKVTVMGLGLLGRGIGDAALIAECGAAEVVVTDLKNETELQASVAELNDHQNIRFVLGEHREEDFRDRDLVLVAAGVPLDSPFVAVAHESSKKVAQSAALFAELSDIPVIGVTGTRGKSTVTNMIHHTLQFVTGEQILLGGNIRGVSNLQLLTEVREDSIAVMELDSWQLQGWGWIKRSPQVAVFTSFMEDHLNYYQSDGQSKEEAMSAYFSDKANIFRYQKEGDVFITTPDIFDRAKSLDGVTLGQEVVLADVSSIPDDTLLAMPGEHNRLNAALAYEALKAISLTEEEIFAGLASFPGVEGRLQLVGEVNDVKIYNDNNATTPAATAAGIRAVGTADDKNVILVAGGADKQLPTDELVAATNEYCKQVCWLSGSGTTAVCAEVGGEVYETLAEAVKAGMTVAEAGDVLLFSPAFASFGHYQNEYQRNDDFLRIIDSL
jgi:UDP-N-acetylmuramoylalanine--D-glutamate ligase